MDQIIAVGSYPPTPSDALRGDLYAVAVYGFILAALAFWCAYHRIRKPRYDGWRLFVMVGIAVIVVLFAIALRVVTA